jgi:hypothetical protein
MLGYIVIKKKCSSSDNINNKVKKEKEKKEREKKEREKKEREKKRTKLEKVMCV